MIPETGETDEVSPSSRGGEGHQVEPGRPSEFTRGAGRTRKSERWSSLGREPERQELHSQNSKTLQRAPSPQFAECWPASAHDETTRGQEENHREGLQRAAASAHTGPAILRADKLEPLSFIPHQLVVGRWRRDAVGVCISRCKLLYMGWINTILLYSTGSYINIL